MFIRLFSTVVILLLSVVSAYSQGTFQPRDADEMEAWQIYNQYKESRRVSDPLERQIKGKFNDSLMGAYGTYGILGVEQTDRAEAVALRNTEQAELERQARLLEAWNKKFYWRYGDLTWFTDKIKDAKTGREMDRIEFALTYFPFNPKNASSETPSTAAVAQKGAADSWSQVTVSLNKVGGFKTEDRPGWRNNGTGFTAEAFGPIAIRISIVGKGGVSYFDYTTNVTVRSSDGKVLLAERPVLSKDGGNASFNINWTPSSAGSAIDVNVSITGGNPEYFTYFVSGRVTARSASATNVGTVRETPAVQLPTRQTVDPASVRTLFNSGNDYGVANGGKPPVFTLKATTVITQIISYHWNNGQGAPGGTITLMNTNGDKFGPWQVSVRANVYWEVNQQIKLPAGTYTVFDSDPATWAQNSQSGGHGMVTIKGSQ
ncbi:MAG: hypothetical protein K1X36_03805 [Pyrinomonadaceae bacterium]|nr:hypothetical protein [Pyrinomonadaceae bacterium]